ncbi:unnamed protein product [Adineta ricciae]|uniref:Uncharacterized protein n=1 Tax=Adineta ricciae TaxID=249248 RepID=A0A813QH40_ADIRI|nr:unnamed protein product [Adineta ricciae]
MTQTQYFNVLPLLNDHFYPADFSSLYENFVLLSCSSHSYTLSYCYYLPYIALAWRRIGYEPVVFLVGQKEVFLQMPLMHTLNVDFKITYHFVDVDPPRSISASQIVRLFGGFLSYNYNTTKDLFILIADVDLLPITRRRFEIFTNRTNYILAVNAYCCLKEQFSYANFSNIHYYPMSYVGMRKDLWQMVFQPTKRCSSAQNLTVDMIECYLKEYMNITLPKYVVKGSKKWDLDQKLLSLLLARAKYFYGTHIDRRDLGYRLDANENFLSSEMNSILFYDDIHLPNKNVEVLFSEHTWPILKRIFSRLFNNKTMQLLSQYHHQTTTMLRLNETNR